MIKIWDDKTFIHNHTTIKIKRAFQSLQYIQLPSGLGAHITYMIIEIQFGINVNTKYFNTRCWFQLGIFNNDIQIVHFLIISTHEHSLKFGRVGCEWIFREPVHHFVSLPGTRSRTRTRIVIIIGIYNAQTYPAQGAECSRIGWLYRSTLVK